MANTIITSQMFPKETVRKLDREVVFLNHTDRSYEGEITQAGDSVRVQTLPTLTFTASSVTGAGDFTNADTGTGPGGSITATDFTITVDNLIVDQYSEKRVIITDHQAKQSPLALLSDVSTRFSEGIGTMLDDAVVTQILTTQVADIPAANKINSATPVTLTVSNVYGEIMKLRNALKKQNVKVKNMRLFVSSDVETVLLQSSFINGSSEGVKIMKNGYIGSVGGVAIYSTTALDASNEMIMMAEGAVNTALQIVDSKITDGDDGFYKNVLAWVVFGMKIFGENAKAIAVNYVDTVTL